MTITLIKKEEHSRLLELQQKFPALTFQNEGYEYIKQHNLTEEDKAALEEISTLLAKTVKGFKKFNNFTYNKAGELRVRIQFDWTADSEHKELPFTGVGYVTVDELMNGFKENQAKE